MLLFVLAAVLLAPHYDSHGITPEAVAGLLKDYGAKEAVRRLAERDPADTESTFGDYDEVLRGVESGDPRWLALVPRLDPGTDAGTAEFLRIAVAEALPKNPAGVLRFASQLSWFRYACGYPMIEPTKREMRAYFAMTIPALKAVHNPALAHSKHICLAELIKAQRSP